MMPICEPNCWTRVSRLRKEAPEIFLALIGEWLRPQRTPLWPNGIQAVISAASDPDFTNLPPLMKVVEPIVEAAAPAELQNEIEELILTLYAASPTETTYFVRQILTDSKDPRTSYHIPAYFSLLAGGTERRGSGVHPRQGMMLISQDKTALAEVLCGVDAARSNLLLAVSKCYPGTASTESLTSETPDPG